MQPSPERIRFNELLEEFKASLTPGALVYDIGKSEHWDYAPFFHGFRYKTIDCDEKKKPDCLLDIEVPGNSFKVKSADAILCHGVVEQCNDLVKLLHGVWMLLKPGGKVLFGFISVGYPIFEFDRIRLTPKGVEHYAKNFKIFWKELFFRPGSDVPSYIFMKGEK
jgi:SAM-dependent methyltransferase